MCFPSLIALSVSLTLGIIGGGKLIGADWKIYFAALTVPLTFWILEMALDQDIKFLGRRARNLEKFIHQSRNKRIKREVLSDLRRLPGLATILISRRKTQIQDLDRSLERNDPIDRLVEIGQKFLCSNADRIFYAVQLIGLIAFALFVQPSAKGGHTQSEEAPKNQHKETKK